MPSQVQVSLSVSLQVRLKIAQDHQLCSLLFASLVMEVGGKHPGVFQDQFHHRLCLGLASMEKSLPTGIFLFPTWEVSVQVFWAFIETARSVIRTYRVSQKKWCIAISNNRVVLDDQRLIKLTDTWSAPPWLLPLTSPLEKRPFTKTAVTL